jgi:hypothetical protein
VINYKLGLKKPVPGSVALKFSAVFDATELPTPPGGPWGRSGLVKDYGMLGNDQYGDCVEAGTDHLIMLRNALNGVSVTFTETNALADYTAMTGFESWNLLSDQGTDIQAAAAYWQKSGMVDSDGNRHTIDAYVDIQIGNINEVLQASWLFGGVGIGVNLPSSAESQFDANQPWTIVDTDSNEGGHYFPIIDQTSNGDLVAVTWGREQPLTKEWLAKYMIFGVGYLSKDILNKSGLSPTQINYAALDQYLKELPQ